MLGQRRRNYALITRTRLLSVPDRKWFLENRGLSDRDLRRMSGLSGNELLARSLRSFLEQFYETEGRLDVRRRSGLSRRLWVGFRIV